MQETKRGDIYRIELGAELMPDGEFIPSSRPHAHRIMRQQVKLSEMAEIKSIVEKIND